VLDPSGHTSIIGATGIERDTFKRSQLMDRYGVQINKTLAQHRAVHDDHRTHDPHSSSLR